jgi:hypothetical protein
MDTTRKTTKAILEDLVRDMGRRPFLMICFDQDGGWRYLTNYDDPELLSELMPSIESAGDDLATHVFEVIDEDKEGMDQRDPRESWVRRAQLISELIMREGG